MTFSYFQIHLPYFYGITVHICIGKTDKVWEMYNFDYGNILTVIAIDINEKLSFFSTLKQFSKCICNDFFTNKTNLVPLTQQLLLFQTGSHAAHMARFYICIVFDMLIPHIKTQHQNSFYHYYCYYYYSAWSLAALLLIL